MGRMHSKGKGISKSALPYRRTPPSWLKTTPTEVVEQVSKLAKKGLTPSQIGVILRDSNGIAQVSHVTGSKVLRILKKQGACHAGQLSWHRTRARRRRRLAGTEAALLREEGSGSTAVVSSEADAHIASCRWPPLWSRITSLAHVRDL